jgi:hypothetical protein
MNCKQAFISESLSGLITGFRKKYNLTTYKDSLQPCTFIGMYRDKDFDAYVNHKAYKEIIFTGSDALNINKEWIRKLKKADKIYAISEQIQKSLEKNRIESILKTFNPTIADQWKPTPNGNSIYWYYGKGAEDFYGAELIKEIESKISIPIIKANYKTFNKSDLYKIYQDCFINLRLTPHDGCPNTNLQMGLMGRRSIYNGDLPHSIRWESVNDIINAIESEYETRHQDNTIIANDFYNFVKNN